jgi:protein disulfide-isomerase
MKRQVWADEAVRASVNAQFIPVAIDVGDPDNAAVLARYHVGGAPVTIITDPQGNALRWRTGGIGKAEFLEFHPPQTTCKPARKVAVRQTECRRITA